MSDTSLTRMQDLLRQFRNTRAEVNKAADRMIDHDVEENHAMRKAVNRIVRIISDQSNMDVHTVWVLAYHEHHKRGGIHAVVESGGKGTHLDAIEKAGELPHLFDTVKAMLTMKEFTSKRTS